MSENKLEKPAVADLIAEIRDRDDKVRAEAFLNAGKVGAPAVKPLAALMAEMELEVATLTKQAGVDKGELAYKLEVGRAAKRGLWQIVRYVGRPGADGERKPVVAELVAMLGNSEPVVVRREAMWTLSEIGGDESVEPVAALLSNTELREDARMVLERLPGRKSLDALHRGLRAAPPDFKFNIAQSLRARRVAVPGIPSRKLVPTRKTSVKPVEFPSK